MGRKPPLDEEPATMEPATLQPNAELFADVKAFAAQLGFGSGGDGDDAFADFAPGKAKKKLKTKKNSADALKTTSDTIATTSAKVSDAPSSNGHHGAAVNNKSKKRPSEAEHQHPATAAHNAGSPAPPPKRQNAVASAGPAPRSLLRNDEPGLWWEHADALPSALRAPLSTAPSQALVEAKRRRGEELLEAEAAAFEAAAERQRGGSSLQWLQQAQKGGTTADKVAAMAVLVQESPAANLRALDGLLTMAGKKGGARAVVGSTLDVLRELWEDVLLPRSRKLRYLEQQPLDALSSLSAREADRALLLWTVEDGLKKRYATFVESLDALSRDNLDFVKDRALKVAFDLLTSRPEQEAALLSALVNKLGDPGRKLASKAGYFLMRLLSKHPGMKTVVVREIERFVFRPGLADRARYYAVVYLNQMTLTHRDAMVSAAAAPNNKTNNDSDKKKKKKNGAEQGDESGSLARRMVDLYFTLFKLITEGKLGTSASLAQAASDRKRREQEAKAARRGKKKFKSGKVDASRVQRASVQPQDAEGKGEEEQDNNDKHYHRAAQSGEIDSRMLSALITGVRRAFPYVAAEEVEPLIEAHTDALFRLIHTGSFGVATQALLLLYQLMTARSAVSDRFYRALYAALASPELPRSTKAPMFLSLLFKAVRADVSQRRAAAFIKRLLQVAAEAPPNFACGCLMMTSELMKSVPALWNAILQPEDRDDDAIETFRDVVEEEEEEIPSSGGTVGKSIDDSDEEGLGEGNDDEDIDGDDEVHLRALMQQPRPAKPASVANKHAKRNAALTTINNSEQNLHGSWPAPGGSGYDMRKRDPQFSRAERSCLWEILLLASHAHPSVAAMARTLLAGANVSYHGDPLRDLTLAAFLDKFVEKKPKAVPRGDSAMQPLRATTTNTASAIGGGEGLHGGLAATTGVTLTAAFAQLAERDIAPDDAFFHKYYSLQAVQGTSSKNKRKLASSRSGGEGGGSDGTASSDEDFDDHDSDSAEVDALLAAEEEGGEEGIGADPDRSLKYDYAGLAAAMDEDSELSLSQGSEGSPTDSVPVSEEEEEQHGVGDGSASSDGDESSLEGAEFSDVSGGSSSDGDGRGASSGSEDSHDERADDGDGSGSESEDHSLLDSPEDVSEQDDDDGDGDGDDPESDDVDDAAADAEVAELLARIKHARAKGIGKAKDGARGKRQHDDSESASEQEDGGLNPFELAEASTSGSEESGGGSSTSSSSGESDLDLEDFDEGSEEEEDEPPQRKKTGQRSGESIYASADDYDDLIARDLAGEDVKVGRNRTRIGGGGGGAKSNKVNDDRKKGMGGIAKRQKRR